MNSSNSFYNLFNIITQQKEKGKGDLNVLNKEKQKIGYLSSRLIKLLISFTNILKTCDGRDKLCAFIQYTSKFQSTILYHAIDLENSKSNEDPFQKHDALKNVEKSMSSGRKIFRFLKWLEDLKMIYYYIIYKDTSIRNLFKAMMCLSAFFYHIFDNLVWSSNVGAISEYFVGDIKLKNTKNVFSFLRNLIKIVMDIYKLKSLYLINRKIDEEVYEAFEKRVENFQTDLHKKLLDQAIYLRAKLRIKLLDIIHSFLRLCMLLYSLKFEPFYSNLHPIFNGFCGMMHSVISLYKCFCENNQSNLEKKSKLNLAEGKIKKKTSLEDIIDELDEKDYGRILQDKYFENYYVDFNKDYPTHPNDIIYYKSELRKRSYIS